MPPPLLSLLVPAYGYAVGVRRILDGIAGFDPAVVEVIIFDDSAGAAVEDAIRPDERPIVKYHRNRPPLGAVANWNALLDAARGDYCLLMHHDEFPLSAGFVAALLSRLAARPAPDVLVLDCILVDPETGRNRRHVPDWLRRRAVYHSPNYLFRRNLIGPASVLVARRPLYPRFDPRLKWLVDVDAYVRLLAREPAVAFAPDVQVASYARRGESITAGVRDQVGALERDERRLLRTDRVVGSIWLDSGALPSALRLAEAAAWGLMRALTCPWPGPLAAAAVRERAKTSSLPAQ